MMNQIRDGFARQSQLYFELRRAAALTPHACGCRRYALPSAPGGGARRALGRPCGATLGSHAVTPPARPWRAPPCADTLRARARHRREMASAPTAAALAVRRPAPSMD